MTSPARALSAIIVTASAAIVIRFFLTLNFAVPLTGGLRTNLAGEKKRDFGFDDLRTLPCSECLV
jgi:hypothetical protein